MERVERLRQRPMTSQVRDPMRVAAHRPLPEPAARAPVHEPPRRSRRRKMMSHDDQFWLPVDEIPDDLTYEWKRLSNVGEENPFYIAQMLDQGWEPVPSSRHPNWVPPGYDKPHIIKGGQILMDRPKELTEEARREERDAAKRQVRDAEARLGMTPKGELTRNFPGLDNRVTKEMMRPVLVKGED
jgi:hypothetical protein